MSLKSEFDREVSGISGKKGEITLFRALERAFAAAYGKRCIVSEFHGSKYQVKFDYTYVPGVCPIAPITVRCELCDLLIIAKGIYHGKDMTRYTFLQAKRSKFDVPSKGKFESSLRQHYLLSQFPVVQGVWRRIPNNILSSHITESIGSFGVFFPANGGYDMVYSIANNIQLWDKRVNITSIANNGSRLHGFINMSPKIQNLRGFDEILFCESLDEFDTAINNMLVGEPIMTVSSGSGAFLNNLDDPSSFVLGVIEAIEQRKKEQYPSDYDQAAVIENYDIGCDVIILDLR